MSTAIARKRRVPAAVRAMRKRRRAARARLGRQSSQLYPTRKHLGRQWAGTVPIPQIDANGDLTEYDPSDEDGEE